MALQSLVREALWPGHWNGVRPDTYAAGTTATLDAAGEYASFIFEAKEDMTISHVGFRGVASGSPTVDVRIETVDATTGLPSGTLWATNTNIITGTLSGTFTTMFALTASASITRGQSFAIKIVYNSGTSCTVQSNASSMTFAKPYRCINTGSPTLSQFGNWSTVAVGSSATALYYLPYCYFCSAMSIVGFDNTTAGTMRGMRFKFPFKARISGLMYGATSTVAVDRKLNLYSDAGTLIKSTTFDGDIATTGSALLIDRFDASQELSADTWYRIALEPTEAANVRIATATIGDAGYRSGIPGGDKIEYATYTTAGGWVDTSTTVPLMDIMIDQLDDGVSTGGAVGGGIAGLHGITNGVVA